MSMSDPIADLLTRIRNALMARRETVAVPASSIKAEIVALLKQQGYVESFKIVRDGVQGEIRIRLRYAGDRPAIRGIRRVSRPGRRIYVKAAKVAPVLSGTGMAVISTNKGVLSDTEAREAKVGGEHLLTVW